MSRQTFYVTTPIYYVNDSPHIGHSYTTIAADVLARFWRSEGRDVHFLTGTDEHGIKIVKAAAERGIEPQQLADEVVVHFQDLWRDLNISNDDFIRTTEARHENRVRRITARLVESGDIYLGQYEGWYDEGDEAFVTESVARENDYRGELSGKPLVRYGEESYFFRLTKYVPRLVEHIEANPTFIQPAARRNEVLSKLAQGVDDLCVSRPREKLPWGVEMPNDPAHVVWVWIDALSNYYTALGCPEIGDEHDGEAKQYWPCNIHLIGKDILWFHAVYWPCILMAADIPLPKCVFAHGWWTSEGRKMSKSLGNFISRETIAEICREYSTDVYRWFLLRSVAFGSDGDFSRDMLRQRYNTELANGVGNLLNRTVNMVGRYFDGVVPTAGADVPEGKAVLASADELRQSAPNDMNMCDFRAYLERIVALVGATNTFIDITVPFKLAKDDTQRDRLATILYTCAESVRIILLYLQPFMPETVEAGLLSLGWTRPDELLSVLGQWGAGPPGAKVTKAQPLFPRNV